MVKWTFSRDCASFAASRAVVLTQTSLDTPVTTISSEIAFFDSLVRRLAAMRDERASAMQRGPMPTPEDRQAHHLRPSQSRELSVDCPRNRARPWTFPPASDAAEPERQAVPATKPM